MFKNVNGRTDGRRRRTPDPWVSYKLIGEPSAQMSLKWGKSGVGIEIIKMDYFQYFSIKLYIVDVY